MHKAQAAVPHRHAELCCQGRPRWSHLPASNDRPQYHSDTTHRPHYPGRGFPPRHPLVEGLHHSLVRPQLLPPPRLDPGPRPRPVHGQLGIHRLWSILPGRVVQWQVVTHTAASQYPVEGAIPSGTGYTGLGSQVVHPQSVPAL